MTSTLTAHSGVKLKMWRLHTVQWRVLILPPSVRPLSPQPGPPQMRLCVKLFFFLLILLVEFYCDCTFSSWTESKRCRSPLFLSVERSVKSAEDVPELILYNPLPLSFAPTFCSLLCLYSPSGSVNITLECVWGTATVSSRHVGGLSFIFQMKKKKLEPCISVRKPTACI